MQVYRCATLPHRLRSPESHSNRGAAKRQRTGRSLRNTGSAPENGADRYTCPPTRPPATGNSYSVILSDHSALTIKHMAKGEVPEYPMCFIVNLMCLIVKNGGYSGTSPFAMRFTMKHM